jgi:uncharacterized protein (PEP-CTERM system associated)
MAKDRALEVPVQSSVESPAVTLIARAVALVLCLGTGTAGAQQSGLTILPHFAIGQSWSDNVGLRASARDAALITRLSPGLSLSSNAGRIKGGLNYSLNEILYTGTNQSNQLQHALSASGSAELLENTFFVDANASISQQAVSAFGPQTIDPLQNNPNNSQLSSLAISPSLRGRLSGLVSYELRANAGTSEVKGSTLGSSSSSGGSLGISGLNTGLLGWNASVSTQQNQARAGVDNRSSQMRLGLSYRPDPELQLGLNAGQERSNYLGAGQTRSSNGASANWTPTPRTALAAVWQGHAYGNSHNLSLQHRMARSSWRFLDSQGVALGSTAATGLQTNYDLFYLQFASIEPDPAARDILVRSYLQGLGLGPNAIATSGFLAAGPIHQHSRQVSFSVEGLRATVTAMLSQSRSSQVGNSIPAVGDFSKSSSVLQRGMSLNLAYRLTPISSLNISISQQRSRGDLASQSTTSRSYSSNLSIRVGQRTSVSVGVRHSSSEGAAPYRENAILANLVQQF